MERERFKDRGLFAKGSNIVSERVGPGESEVVASTRVSALEGEDGILNEQAFKDILVKTFPQGWVRNEVLSIRQIDEEKAESKRSDAKGLEGWEVIAGIRHGAGHWGQIRLYSPIKEYKLFSVLGFIAHELGHANDWEHDNEMSIEERMDMLLAVSERLQAEDRFYSHYVESIENENPQAELYLKAKEYWAMICEQYYREPLMLSIEDALLVEEHIKKSDPDFDFLSARLARDSILAAGIESH